MVMVAAFLVCRCIVVVDLVVIVVVACIDLLSLLVCVVVVVMDVAVLRLVCCASIVGVVVVGTVVVFLDCGDFSMLCVGLFCFVDCCFVVVSFVEVVWLVPVLRLVELVV